MDTNLDRTAYVFTQEKSEQTIVSDVSWSVLHHRQLRRKTAELTRAGHKVTLSDNQKSIY